jgi:restriction endonuclease S subunit
VFNKEELQTIIQKILSKLDPKDDNTSILAQKLTEITEIQKRKWEIRKQQQEMKDRHNAEIGDLRKEEVRNHNRCPHYISNYHGDPAGGNDSYSDCDICGFQKRGYL